MAAVTSPRNQSNQPSHTGSSRDLGWWGVFPPIEHGDGCSWLPLSDAALTAVASAISRSASVLPREVASESDLTTTDPFAVSELCQAFSSDPPLLLFALSRWPGTDFVSLTDLAEWFVAAAPAEFSGGEWILAAPEFSSSHQRHWSRLMAQSRNMQPVDALTLAKQWMSVLGDPPSEDWCDRLPAIIWDRELGSKNELLGSRLLQRLAQNRERELAVESSLSSLAEQRKNAAAKQLAYGLSHEINNPLANISARAQQLSREEIHPERLNSLEQIVRQVYRAHEMIAGLMFYANPPRPDLGLYDLNELLNEASSEFTPVAEAVGIRFLTEVVAMPAMVTVDRMMILEAIRVLVRNSIEAIGSGGTVVLSIQGVDGDEEVECWRVHVADSGPGLTAEASRHAFDPFYSGREAGRGLGIGLCRAYRVAQLHDATIRIAGGLAGCVATLTVPKARMPEHG